MLILQWTDRLQQPRIVDEKSRSRIHELHECITAEPIGGRFGVGQIQRLLLEEPLVLRGQLLVASPRNSQDRDLAFEKGGSDAFAESAGMTGNDCLDSDSHVPESNRQSVPPSNR
jgi:hypothetical protein